MSTTVSNATGAVTWVDSINGNDTSAARGSFTARFKTISAALAVSISGDLIQVFPGTYNETLVMVSGVSVYGLDERNCIISRSSAVPETIITMADNMYFRNFRIIMSPSLGQTIGVLMPGTTNATSTIQLIREVASPTGATTTIAAGSNGASLPQATINVISTSGFPSSGTVYIVTSAGTQTVTYTGITATTFTGGSGGTGTMSTGGGVAASPVCGLAITGTGVSSELHRTAEFCEFAGSTAVCRAIDITGSGSDSHIKSCKVDGGSGTGINIASGATVSTGLCTFIGSTGIYNAGVALTDPSSTWPNYINTGTWNADNSTGPIQLGAQIAFNGVITPTILSSTVDNYNPTGMANASLLRISSNASGYAVTGLVSGFTGRILTLHNVGSFNILVADENTNSSAINRISIPGSSNLTLIPDQCAFLQYDGTSSRWRILGASPVSSAVTPTNAMLTLNLLSDNLNSPPTISGTVTTNGTTTITGSGTSFLSTLTAGMYIQISNQTTRYYQIATITSNTSLTLTTAYTGASAGGLSLIASYEADAYVVGASPTGAWSGYSTGDIIVWLGSGSYTFGGTLSTTNGSTSVTGTGTSFTNINPGTLLIVNSPTAIAGTVSVTNGNATITGTGTTFTNLFVGQQLQFSNQAGTIYTIQTITSNLSITLSVVFSGSTNASVTAFAGTQTNAVVSSITNNTSLTLVANYTGITNSAAITSVAAGWRRISVGTGSAPITGATAIITALQGTPSGSFTGQADNVATYNGTSWGFSTPALGSSFVCGGAGDPFEGASAVFKSSTLNLPTPSWQINGTPDRTLSAFATGGQNAPTNTFSLAGGSSTDTVVGQIASTSAGFTITPPAGTYTLDARTTLWNATDSAATNIIFVSAYAGGSKILGTERQTGFGSTRKDVGVFASVTVTGFQAVEFRWRTFTTATGSFLTYDVYMRLVRTS